MYACIYIYIYIYIYIQAHTHTRTHSYKIYNTSSRIRIAARTIARLVASRLPGAAAEAGLTLAGS